MATLVLFAASPSDAAPHSKRRRVEYLGVDEEEHLRCLGPERGQPETAKTNRTDKAPAVTGLRKTQGGRGQPWTEDEHRQFLTGLQRFGKGDWRSISTECVPSRTPTQVASHAQKYFLRLTSGTQKRRPRQSLFDIVSAGQTTIDQNEGERLQAEMALRVIHAEHSTQALHFTPSKCSSSHSAWGSDSLTGSLTGSLVGTNDSHAPAADEPGPYCLSNKISRKGAADCFPGVDDVTAREHSMWAERKDMDCTTEQRDLPPEEPAQSADWARGYRAAQQQHQQQWREQLAHDHAVYMAMCHQAAVAMLSQQQMPSPFPWGFPMGPAHPQATVDGLEGFDSGRRQDRAQDNDEQQPSHAFEEVPTTSASKQANFVQQQQQSRKELGLEAAPYLQGEPGRREQEPVRTLYRPAAHRPTSATLEGIVEAYKAFNKRSGGPATLRPGHRHDDEDECGEACEDACGSAGGAGKSCQTGDGPQSSLSYRSSQLVCHTAHSMADNNS